MVRLVDGLDGKGNYSSYTSQRHTSFRLKFPLPLSNNNGNNNNNNKNNDQTRNLNLQFVWDPFFNSSALHEVQHLSSKKHMPVGFVYTAVGLWYSRHFESDQDMLSNYKGALNRISFAFDSLRHLEANSIFQAPALYPNVKALDEGRRKSLTHPKINKINKEILKMNKEKKNALVPSVFNKFSLNHLDVYDVSGIHFLEHFATIQASVLTNIRCNRVLNEEGVVNYQACCAKAPSKSQGIKYTWIPLTIVVGMLIIFKKFNNLKDIKAMILRVMLWGIFWYAVSSGVTGLKREIASSLDVLSNIMGIIIGSIILIASSNDINKSKTATTTTVLTKTTTFDNSSNSNFNTTGHGTIEFNDNNNNTTDTNNRVYFTTIKEKSQNIFNLLKGLLLVTYAFSYVLIRLSAHGDDNTLLHLSKEIQSWTCNFICGIYIFESLKVGSEMGEKVGKEIKGIINEISKSNNDISTLNDDYEEEEEEEEAAEGDNRRRRIKRIRSKRFIKKRFKIFNNIYLDNKKISDIGVEIIKDLSKLVFESWLSILMVWTFSNGIKDFKEQEGFLKFKSGLHFAVTMMSTGIISFIMFCLLEGFFSRRVMEYHHPAEITRNMAKRGYKRFEFIAVCLISSISYGGLSYIIGKYLFKDNLPSSATTTTTTTIKSILKVPNINLSIFKGLVMISFLIVKYFQRANERERLMIMNLKPTFYYFGITTLVILILSFKSLIMMIMTMSFNWFGQTMIIEDSYESIKLIIISLLMMLLSIKSMILTTTTSSSSSLNENNVTCKEVKKNVKDTFKLLGEYSKEVLLLIKMVFNIAIYQKLAASKGGVGGIGGIVVGDEGEEYDNRNFYHYYWTIVRLYWGHESLQMNSIADGILVGIMIVLGAKELACLSRAVVS